MSTTKADTRFETEDSLDEPPPAFPRITCTDDCKKTQFDKLPTLTVTLPHGQTVNAGKFGMHGRDRMLYRIWYSLAFVMLYYYTHTPRFLFELVRSISVVLFTREDILFGWMRQFLLLTNNGSLTCGCKEKHSDLYLCGDLKYEGQSSNVRKLTMKVNQLFWIADFAQQGSHVQFKKIRDKVFPKFRFWYEYKENEVNEHHYIWRPLTVFIGRRDLCFCHAFCLMVSKLTEDRRQGFVGLCLADEFDASMRYSYLQKAKLALTPFETGLMRTEKDKNMDRVQRGLFMMKKANQCDACKDNIYSPQQAFALTCGDVATTRSKFCESVVEDFERSVQGISGDWVSKSDLFLVLSCFLNPLFTKFLYCAGKHLKVKNEKGIVEKELVDTGVMGVYNWFGVPLTSGALILLYNFIELLGSNLDINKVASLHDNLLFREEAFFTPAANARCLSMFTLKMKKRMNNFPPRFYCQFFCYLAVRQILPVPCWSVFADFMQYAYTLFDYKDQIIENGDMYCLGKHF